MKALKQQKFCIDLVLSLKSSFKYWAKSFKKGKTKIILSSNYKVLSYEGNKRLNIKFCIRNLLAYVTKYSSKYIYIILINLYFE